MTPTETAEKLYTMYHKGYKLIVKDVFQARELAMKCAIDQVNESLRSNKEYYLPILEELHTMCEYMGIKIKK